MNLLNHCSYDAWTKAYLKYYEFRFAQLSLFLSLVVSCGFYFYVIFLNLNAILCNEAEQI